MASVYRRTGMAEDRERVVRLEARSKEAENALQQLRTYIELLKKKAGVCTLSVHFKHLIFYLKLSSNYLK